MASVPPEAVAALRASDPVLAELIDRIGPIEPAHEPDLWWSLVDAIVSQQLSIKAAATILGRVAALAPEGRRPTPQEILETEDEVLRVCGLSRAKVIYVKDLAARWLDGSLEPERLPAMPDEEVIEHLVQVKGIGRWTAEMVLMFTLRRPDVLPVDDLGLQVKGIGRWTAEMVLMFTLRRPDVFPVDDLGIRVAVQEAYGLEARPGRAELEALGERWRPWRSIASFYLWRSRRK